MPAGTVVAGTMQLSVADHADDLLASVPRLPGLHLLNWYADNRPCLLGFARVAGEPQVIDLQALLLDDEEDCAPVTILT